MSGRRSARSTTVLIVAVLCVTSVFGFGAVASAPGAAQQAGANESGSERGIVVQQGAQCYPLEAFGNGSTSVETFYDYRSPETNPPGWYSSYGNRTEELMAPNTSQVFLYNGSEGLSLVFLHDGVGTPGTTGSGGTVTMDISGLPADGNWSVQDDDYAEQDDVFDLDDGSAYIEWVWNEGNRSDGGAYTGLEGNGWQEIVIEPRFNEASPRYPFERWNGPPESNRIDSWIARSANESGGNVTGTAGNATAGVNGSTNLTGPSATTVNGTSYELDMNDPITIARGPCDAEPPTASLTANPQELTPGEQVTLDASGSADNDAIASYRWDRDGDGTVDTVTNESVLTTTYNQSGSYDARVTVVDRANNTANASVSLQVQEETATTTTTTTSTHTAADDGGGGGTTTAQGSGTGTASGSPEANGNDDGDGDGGILGALPADASGIDGPSLLGLVVLTLALCVLAVVVLRR